jgi:hypothetical protein
MASVVILLGGAAVYALHKRHEEKKALKLEAEYDEEFARQNRQNDDASSIYSDKTLTNEGNGLINQARNAKRTESAEKTEKTGLREKVKGVMAKARARDAGVGHGRVEQVAY